MVQTSVRLSLSIMEESFYACYLLKRTFENKLNISNDCIENINMTVKVNRNVTSMELLIMSCRMSTTFYTKRQQKILPMCMQKLWHDLLMFISKEQAQLRKSRISNASSLISKSLYNMVELYLKFLFQCIFSTALMLTNIHF